MSRTDKTTPYWVKIGLRPIAHHDHADGRCDLPDDPFGRRFGHPGHCYWEYKGIHEGERICGCRMCTSYYERKWARRKERRAGRAACRDLD